MRLLDNAWLKFFSVIFAFTLWFYVQGRDIVETSVKFSIVYAHIPDGLYIDETSATELHVWIKAPKHALSGLLKTDKKIELDLKGGREGKVQFNVTEADLDLPRMFEVVKLQPEKITVRLAAFVTKEVPVKPQYRGNRTYRIEPPRVTIVGDRRTVDSVREVWTEAINETENRDKVVVQFVSPAENVKISRDRATILFNRQGR